MNNYEKKLPKFKKAVFYYFLFASFLVMMIIVYRIHSLSLPSRISSIVKDKENPKVFKNSSQASLKYGNGLTFQCSLGQLGNRMFYYAVIYGLSRLNNRTGLIQRCNTNTCRWSESDCAETPLDEVFNLTLSIIPDIPAEEQRGYPIHFSIQYPNDCLIPANCNILTGENYPVSVTHFLHVREEVRREFQFKSEILSLAEIILKQMQGSRKTATFIGLHVRRNDYLNHLKNFGKSEAPLEFFRFGLEYFRKKYTDAIFVVRSDDLEWCKKNIVGEDIYTPGTVSPQEQDLCVLSICNHTIFDYGTYGFWAGFLAGGEVIYFIDGITDPQTSDSNRAKIMYPPEWIGVSKTIVEMWTAE